MLQSIGWFMVFNTNFNNISVISWQSVLLMEETGVPCEKPLIYRKSFSHNRVSDEYPSPVRDSNTQR